MLADSKMNYDVDMLNMKSITIINHQLVVNHSAVLCLMITRTFRKATCCLNELSYCQIKSCFPYEKV